MQLHHGQRLSSAVRVSASQSLGSRFKIPPGSRFFDLFKNRCQCSVDERSLPWIWYFWFVNWEKGFVSVLQLVSKQLHSSRLHCSDVEWGAFAYHGIWESGQMLGVHSRPSDGDVKWRSREAGLGANSHPCLVILWTLIEKRRLEISRCSSTIITRYNGFHMSYCKASLSLGILTTKLTKLSPNQVPGNDELAAWSHAIQIIHGRLWWSQRLQILNLIICKTVLITRMQNPINVLTLVISLTDIQTTNYVFMASQKHHLPLIKLSKFMKILKTSQMYKK